ACPAPTDGSSHFGVEDLDTLCRAHGDMLRIIPDFQAPESQDLTREFQPDLGLALGIKGLEAELFEIPRLGAIGLHKRKLPDYRGEGPTGLWELLEERSEIGVTVHRVTSEPDAGAIIEETTIAIEPFDTLRSLDLKADAAGIDLLVDGVTAFI